MPTPTPSPFPPTHPSSYPALYLFPLNDSFVPKHISLAGGQRVKIGRQTNAKTVPGERNGYFDSKVLSRQHAEVWEDGGKIFIKDVKSSNGTFINGERLSQEGVESDPYELKTDDIVVCLRSFWFIFSFASVKGVCVCWYCLGMARRCEDAVVLHDVRLLLCFARRC
jgi:hypothetical protein